VVHQKQAGTSRFNESFARQSPYLKRHRGAVDVHRVMRAEPYQIISHISSLVTRRYPLVEEQRAGYWPTAVATRQTPVRLGRDKAAQTRPPDRIFALLFA
jgi:hypothetical protein